MLRYKISKLVIDVECNDPAVLFRMEEYLDVKDPLLNDTEPNMFMKIVCDEEIEVPKGYVISDESIKWLGKEDRTGYFLYTTERDNGSVLAMADITNQWDKGLFRYRNNEGKTPDKSYKTQTEIYLHILMGVLFRNNLLRHNGIVIHASTIKWQGKGIMFSAPSGTGKSTHVRLWQELYGEAVKVLNDDTPAVRLDEKNVFVSGTPWCGSSGIHCNDYAPLEAIVLLEQSPKNEIRKIDGVEAITRLMPRTFLPYQDQTMMALALETLESIITSVPIFVLKCRPDFEAVELVRQCLI